MSLFKRSVTELLGTFWLVLGGCGSAVIAASSPLGIGVLGVALAFGLTVLTMAFAIGHISGCHLNPAVTVGLWAGGRFPASGVLPYIVAQVLGGIAAAAIRSAEAAGGIGPEDRLAGQGQLRIGDRDIDQRAERIAADAVEVAGIAALDDLRPEQECARSDIAAADLLDPRPLVVTELGDVGGVAAARLADTAWRGARGIPLAPRPHARRALFPRFPGRTRAHPQQPAGQ